MSIEILNRMSAMITELAACLGNTLIELGNQGIQYGRSGAEIEALPSVVDGYAAIEKCEALAEEFDQHVIVQLAQLNQARPWTELRERVFASACKGKRSAAIRFALLKAVELRTIPTVPLLAEWSGWPEHLVERELHAIDARMARQIKAGTFADGSTHHSRDS